MRTGRETSIEIDAASYSITLWYNGKLGTSSAQRL